MVIPVPSNNGRFKIRVGIKANTPFSMGIKAFDATKPDTHYFRRKVPFNKKNDIREIIIPLPISPKTLSVELFDKHRLDDRAFKIESFKLEKMPPSTVWASKDMHDFIAFAQDFSEKAGYVDTGFYHSKDYQFLFHYLPQITGQFGETLVTPARTNRVTGRHQISQELFKRFSIPIRLFILLHERQHFTIPTREEIPADLGALKLYLDMGYPTIEAVYAATKVFRLHPESLGETQVKRTKVIIDFINRYKKEKKLNEKVA